MVYKKQRKGNKRDATVTRVNKYAKTGLNVLNLASKVASIVSLLNVEKKRFTINGDPTTPPTVAQINATSASTWVTGSSSFTMTPVPAQGTTSITRNGNSIKLTSSYLKFQFSHQGSAEQQSKGCIYIVQSKGSPETSSTTAMAEYFSTNPFVTGNIDYNTQLNPDYFGQYKTIIKKNFIVKADNVSGVESVTNLNFGLKYNRGKGHHVRFSADGSVSPVGGALYCFIVLDNGNMSGTALTSGTSFANIPIGAAATGLNYNYNILHYFVDN